MESLASSQICVAKSASRALGLIIAKCKHFGGMDYVVFKKVYDSIVLPVITYGAAIWGLQDYSCINAVQNRAGRYFLGVGRYTPTDAVLGDLAPRLRSFLSTKTYSTYDVT